MKKYIPVLAVLALLIAAASIYLLFFKNNSVSEITSVKYLNENNGVEFYYPSNYELLQENEDIKGFPLQVALGPKEGAGDVVWALVIQENGKCAYYEQLPGAEPAKDIVLNNANGRRIRVQSESSTDMIVCFERSKLSYALMCSHSKDVDESICGSFENEMVPTFKINK